MLPDDKNDHTAPVIRPAQVEPPKIYLAACGALCDIFWWARRDPDADESAPPPAKIETP
jgi:hypothetical protein